MSDTDASTVHAEDVLRRFNANPVGFAVQLLDGSEAEVSAFRDTPRGRWLRLRRRGGPWVPDHDVEFLKVYSIGLRQHEVPSAVQVGA